MTRFLLFSGLFITGALILLYPQRIVDPSLYCSPDSKDTSEVSRLEKVEEAEEQEIIEDFELKSWNRSKSIGFLRESKFNCRTKIYLFLHNLLQIAANAAEHRWTEHLVRWSRVYQKEKRINTSGICTTTGPISSSSRRTLSSPLFFSEIQYLGMWFLNF